MCCHTHGDVTVPGALARADNERCRCELGSPCQRRATQEDLRCDVCGGRIDPDAPSRVAEDFLEKLDSEPRIKSRNEFRPIKLWRKYGG